MALTTPYLQYLGLAQVPEASTSQCLVLTLPEEIDIQKSNATCSVQMATAGGAAQSLAPVQGVTQQGAALQNIDEDFKQCFDDALTSALTKFDSLEAYFSSGMLVPAVCSMLLGEIEQDKDFAVEAEREKDVEALVKKAVGEAYGRWKKSNGAINRPKVEKVKDNPLPWSSIDAYPEWVANKIELLGHALPEEQVDARRALEHELLEKPLHAASIKYDGTCFGKMDNGDLVGRKHVLGKLCDTYMQTSTLVAASCDVASLRRTLSNKLGGEVGPVCIWGELMCNPNFYGYKERGLDSQWICFGVVADMSAFVHDSAASLAALSERLAQQGFAHSISAGGKLRLLLCPALRQLLTEVAGCVVADEYCEGLSHAELVAKAAASLQAGENEGLVLVFTRADGQSSLRKWKNSAEGSSVSKKHAQLLRNCQNLCSDLVCEDKLDPRVAEMVHTMLRVAEAKTNPMKKGRTATDKAAK